MSKSFPEVTLLSLWLPQAIRFIHILMALSFARDEATSASGEPRFSHDTPHKAANS